MSTWIKYKHKYLCSIFQEYQKYFQKTKQKLEENPLERQFDFSEMYIFGKFDTFQRRMNKILNMFNTITTYNALQDSKIEGLETMATRFQVSWLWRSNQYFLFLGLQWRQKNIPRNYCNYWIKDRLSSLMAYKCWIWMRYLSVN